jgi:hypothetical protein
LKGLASLLRVCLLLPPLWTCDAALTRLFTPAHPQRGRYEVCTAPDTIERIVAGGGLEGLHYAPIDAVQPLEAFGGAGPYDRSALARLYGGQRVKVARGWRQEGDRFESVTLISPYPDAALTHLQQGTMMIRWEYNKLSANQPTD